MRLFSRYHLTALCVACTLVQVLLCSCRQESVLPSPSPSHGLVVLSLSADDVAFVETRGEQTLSDLSALSLSFTLSGQIADGRTIENLPLTFITTEDNAFVATVETGTYTLSAATPDKVAESDFGTPSYVGKSGEFDVKGSETATVEIHLKPRNARVSVQIDESFSKLYECTKVKLSALSPATKDTRTVTIENPSTKSPAPAAYFLLSPTDSQLTYTLYGNAHKASHQQELPESGVTGTLTLEAGHAYTLNIKANPVTGILIPVIGETHNGEFD